VISIIVLDFYLK